MRALSFLAIITLVCGTARAQQVDPAAVLVTNMEYVVEFNRDKLLAAEKQLPGVLKRPNLPDLGIARAQMRAQRDRVKSARTEIAKFLKKYPNTASDKLARIKAIGEEFRMHQEGGELISVTPPVTVNGWNKDIADVEEAMRKLTP